MKMAGFSFDVMSKNIKEIHPEGLPVEEIPMHLAQLKARALLYEANDNDIIIGADTVVILDGKIFEKPVDRQDAINMLSQLSGKVHKVVTGVCILSKTKEVQFADATLVHFNAITLPEIEYYVDNYKPYDKAGSYACQEWIGAVAINRFEGDYFTVVGLPINRVYKELSSFKDFVPLNI